MGERTSVGVLHNPLGIGGSQEGGNSIWSTTYVTGNWRREERG